MSQDILASEEYWVKQEKIPGSTRVPVEELSEFIKPDENKTILDLGSGEGRSTKKLSDSFPGNNIVAFDLSIEGLKKTTKESTGRVQGTALELPFGNESADAMIICGVMTNITDKEPEKAVEAREKIIKEVARVLKPDGVCVISDFDSEQRLSQYPVDYFRHQLITGEYGTIAVFDPAAGITFRGKSDEEVESLAKSPFLQRFAHHYTPNELIDLVNTQENLDVIKYSVEMGETPSGNPIDTIIMSIKKIKSGN